MPSGVAWRRGSAPGDVVEDTVASPLSPFPRDEEHVGSSGTPRAAPSVVQGAAVRVQGTAVRRPRAGVEVGAVEAPVSPPASPASSDPDVEGREVPPPLPRRRSFKWGQQFEFLK